MTIGVYGLGGLMLLLGLIFVSTGVPIVRMEIGWTEVIGGAVAASAGCVVLVMGLFLSHLEAILESLDRVVTATSPDVTAPPPTLRPTLEDMPASETADPRPLHPLAPALRREANAPPVAEVVGPVSTDPSLQGRSMPAAVRPEPALTAALHPVTTDLAPAAPLVSANRNEPVLAEGAPALTHAEDEAVAHGPAVVGPDAVTDPIADTSTAKGRSAFLSSFLSRRLLNAGASRASDPDPVAPPLDLDGMLPPLADPGPPDPDRRLSLGAAWDDEPSGEDFAPKRHGGSHEREDDAAGQAEGTVVHRSDPLHRAPEPSPPTAPLAELRHEPAAQTSEPAAPLQPVVVGRYNAGAASYVMYSNGMIEVETEQGMHQFASMQELKAYIERRDTRVS